MWWYMDNDCGNCVNHILEIIIAELQLLFHKCRTENVALDLNESYSAPLPMHQSGHYTLPGHAYTIQPGSVYQQGDTGDYMYVNPGLSAPPSYNEVVEADKHNHENEPGSQLVEEPNGVYSEVGETSGEPVVNGDDEHIYEHIGTVAGNPIEGVGIEMSEYHQINLRGPERQQQRRTTVHAYNPIYGLSST